MQTLHRINMNKKMANGTRCSRMITHPRIEFSLTSSSTGSERNVFQYIKMY